MSDFTMNDAINDAINDTINHNMVVDENENISEFQNKIDCKKNSYESVFNLLNQFVTTLNPEFMYEKKIVNKQIINYFVVFYKDVYVYVDYTYSDYRCHWESMWNCNDDLGYYRENQIFTNIVRIKYDDFDVLSNEDEFNKINELKYMINQLEIMLMFENMSF